MTKLRTGNLEPPLMSIEVVVTTNRWRNDPSSREVVEYIRSQEDALQLSGSVIYYDFPAYADYEAATSRPDILLLSPKHGFVAIRILDPSLFRRSNEEAAAIDIALDDFATNLHSRLIRSRELRRGRTGSVVSIYSAIFAPGLQEPTGEGELSSEVCTSLERLGAYISEAESEPLTSEQIAETRSVVEGAKALARPNKRIIADPAAQPLAAAMARLESEILNFDQRQRHIALVDVGGPARIRGLAGSGKTVILAMKAAHLHLNDPNALILVTFYTKSLRATIKGLITKFYRLYSETDPDWKRVHIRHGWGGATIPGVYSEACKRAGRMPLTLPEAKRVAQRGENAFGAACRELVESGLAKPHYDHVLIDEGQDFPAGFYRLCYEIAKGARDGKSIVWAYDELQDIMNVKIRQPDELFGTDADGRPRVDLDRSSVHVPPGASNDAVLSKAYRNQRDVLVSAHALGFGVYGTIVQMLESAEHWEDVGYEVETGPLQPGQQVRVFRPDRNSPLHLPNLPQFPLIGYFNPTSLEEEASWVCSSIKSFLDGGLAPEEIMVVSLDDRHARRYFTTISQCLAQLGISSNNVIADPYNEPPFSISGRVTLSTVYRAKGNEGAVVFAIGLDAIDGRSRDGRNKLFTAFTRSKAWLRVSGIGEAGQRIINELAEALQLTPRIQFVMPDIREIETIQRGFSKRQSAAKAAKEQFLKRMRAAGFSDDEIEEELQQGLLNE
jgi:superfamily I DNA and RNA helicase